MPRIPMPTPETMTPEQRAVSEAILSGPRGSLQGPFVPWLASPELADRAQKLGEYLRFRNALPRDLSELAILVTAQHWRAEFEWWAHARFAREAGLSEAKIEALRLGQRPDAMSEAEAVVYDVASTLWRNRTINQALFDRAITLLGQQALTDLVGVIGYYALVSATLNVFDMPLPDGAAKAFGP